MFEQAEDATDRCRAVGGVSFQGVKACAIPVNDVVAQQTAPNRGFGQQLKRGSVVHRPKHQPQPGLVVLEVYLTPDGEHFAGVDARHVFQRGFASTGAAQILVQVVEERLHVMRHLTPEPATYLPAHVERKGEAVGLRQFTEAGRRGRLVPRFQIEGGIDIRLSAETGPSQDRFQTDAAGEDHDDPAAMVLTVSAQPAEERIGL